MSIHLSVCFKLQLDACHVLQELIGAQRRSDSWLTHHFLMLMSDRANLLLYTYLDEASASHGRAVRSHKSGVGGAGREREALNKQPRNFDGGQIGDVDWRAGIKLWQHDAPTSGMCGDSSHAKAEYSHKST